MKKAKKKFDQRNCEYCGAPYWPKIKTQKYCKDYCNVRAYQERQRADAEKYRKMVEETNGKAE